MTKPQSKGTGCFSGIARIILCKRSLQTHPSDQITEPNTTPIECRHVHKDSKPEVVVAIKSAAAEDAPADAISAPPGVVARLMGLDSLPKTNWVFKGGRTSPDLVTRSRSANFMDYILEFELEQKDEEKRQRKVKTSVSFREVPTLFNNQENQNSDIFVLYLEDYKKKIAESDAGLQEIHKHKEKNKNDKSKSEEVAAVKNYKNVDEPSNGLENQFSRLSSGKGGRARNKKERLGNSMAKSPEKPMNKKEALIESMFMKKIKNQQKEVQSEYCSSEDSSPISILDLDEFMIPYHDEMPWSEKKQSAKTNFDYASIAHSTRLSIDLEPKELKKKDFRKQSKDSKNYVEVVKKLCKLTEEDIKGTKWVVMEVSDYESFEDICTEMGQEILDGLVKQVVKELVGFHLKTFIDGKVF